NINAPLGNVVFQSQSGGGALFFLMSSSGVNFTSGSTIELSNNVVLHNNSTTGAWVLTASAVTLQDQSSIATTSGAGANLAVHANALSLSAPSALVNYSLIGKTLTIDDIFLGSTGGLTIYGPPSSTVLGNQSGVLNIHATTGNLEFTSAGITNLDSA